MSNAPIAGMNYPTQKAMLAGNPRDSAMQAATNSDVKLANMGKIGGKRIGRKELVEKEEEVLLLQMHKLFLFHNIKCYIHHKEAIILIQILKFNKVLE